MKIPMPPEAKSAIDQAHRDMQALVAGLGRIESLLIEIRDQNPQTPRTIHAAKRAAQRKKDEQ